MNGYMMSPLEDFGKGERIGVNYADCEICGDRPLIFPGLRKEICPLCQMRTELERVKAELERVSKTLNEEIDRQVKRAERAEAQLANGHSALSAAGTDERDGFGANLSIVGRVIQLRERLARAEAAEMERSQDVAALQFIFNVETNKLAKAEEDLKKLKIEFDNRRLTDAGRKENE